MCRKVFELYFAQYQLPSTSSSCSHSRWLRRIECEYKYSGLNVAVKSPVTGVFIKVLTPTYIISLPQSRTMILTSIFVLIAIAAIFQKEDVPFGQQAEGLPEGPDELRVYISPRGTVIFSSTTV